MISIIIDSSVLSPEHFPHGASFRSLKYLGELGAITLYIPAIVHDEFESHLFEAYVNKISKSISGVKNIRNPLNQSFIENDLKEIQGELNKIKSVVVNDLETSFNDWLNSPNFIIKEIAPSHAKNVFTSYFKGKHPFKKIKNRNDLPDAFIWEVVCNLSETIGGPIHFITDDNGFKQSKIDIVYYSSNDEFVRTKEIQEILEEKIPDYIIGSLRELLLENIENIEDNIKRLFP